MLLYIIIHISLYRCIVFPELLTKISHFSILNKFTFETVCFSVTVWNKSVQEMLVSINRIEPTIEESFY